MAKARLLADEPGRYCAKESADGAFVVIDYTLRLSKGGDPILRVQPDYSVLPNTDPWVIWHPRSNHSIGFQVRSVASKAFNSLITGEDVQGLLTLIRGGAATPERSKQLQTNSDSANVTNRSCALPAQARARDLLDYPAEFARALQAKFPPDLLLDRLEEAMTAESPYATNGGIEFRPDWPARLKAMELAKAYLIGRPIERQQILQANAPMSWESILGIAKSSPVFRDTLMGMLKEMEKA